MFNPFTYFFTAICADTAFVLIKLKKYDAAMVWLKRATKYGYLKHVIYNNIAYIELYIRKDLRAGEEALKHAAEGKPNFPTTLINYSYLYLKQKKYDQAIEIAEKIINLKLWFWHKYGYNNKAVAFIRQRKYDEAFEVLKNIPNWDLADFNRGFIYLKKGNFPLAIQYIGKAIMAKSQFQNRFYYSFALAYLQNGEPDKAKEILKIFIKRFPEPFILDENLETWNQLKTPEIAAIIDRLPVKKWEEA